MEEDFSKFRGMELGDLKKKAWEVRINNFGKKISFSTPGPKVFITDYHQNNFRSFQAASITGEKCALKCEHCRGELLKSMKAVPTGGDLEDLGRKIKSRGGHGLLVSGGADNNGRVPFGADHLEALSKLKEMGLKVIVHTGILDREMAIKMKNSGIDMVLFDMIGSEKTIREVYHLQHSVDDYVKSLKIIREIGLKMAPHIIIGHHFGRIEGEYRALLELLKADPDAIVFVVINPIFGTPMENIPEPPIEDISRLVSIARVMAPKARITLGCGKPSGEFRKELEREAFESGVNVIAYPLDETVDYIKNRGFDYKFEDICCCLI